MNVRDLHHRLLDLTGRTFDDMSQAADTVAALMNETYAVLNAGGKVAYVEWPEQPEHPANEGETLNLCMSSQSDMSTMFANARLAYRTDNGHKRQSAFDLWRIAKSRRTYYGVEFSITPRRGWLNLWFGYGVEPAHGDWSLFRRLLVEAVCGNEPNPEAAAEELIKLFAWKLQNMDRLPEKAVVLRGPKGSGKNSVYRVLRRVMGSAYAIAFTNREHVFGRFNAHLQNKALVFLNEAFWRGHHGEEATLKGLITDPELPVEYKFGPMLSARNIMLLMIAANADWVVPASDDERRFVVYDMTDALTEDDNFFGRMFAQMEAGGHGGFLQDMLAMDLGDWHPRQMTDTAGLAQQKQHSLPSMVAWLRALVDDPESAASERRHDGLDYVGHRELLTPFLLSGQMTDVPPAAGRWLWWEDSAVVLGTEAQIAEAFSQWCKRHGRVPRECTSERWVINELRKHLDPELFWKLGTKKRMTDSPNVSPRNVHALAARGEIREHLEKSYPGMFDDGVWVDEVPELRLKAVT